MTTIIKSDNTALNTIGHVSGFKGPADFTAFLDFNRDDYLTNINGTITKYTLDESITVTRTGDANVVTEDGEITNVAGDTPRRTYNFYARSYGVAGEQAATNFVSSPVNPSTQSVTISSGSTSDSIFVTVYGTGTVSLDAPELTRVSGADATQGTAARYTRSTSAAITATLTVTGNVTFVQVEGANRATTPIVGSRNIERTELTDAFKNVITGNEYTIVASINPIFDVPSNNRSALSIVYSNGDLLAIKLSESKTASTTDSLISKVSGAETTLQTITGRGTGGNYSLSRSAANNLIGFTAIRDASRGDATGYVDGTIDRILLLGGAGLNGTAAGVFSGTCQYVAIYNRHLTDQELANCALGPIIY